MTSALNGVGWLLRLIALSGLGAVLVLSWLFLALLEAAFLPNDNRRKT